ncbi:MAG: replicative DNA helicase, partial [Pseudopedobacter saltans]
MDNFSNVNKDKKTNFRRKPSIDLSPMIFGKVPPQAKDLEEAVLGAVMLEKGAFDNVIEVIQAECFYVDAHQKIFKCFQDLAQKSLPIDMLTVVEELKSKGELEEVGGAYYVSKLTNVVTSTANIITHAQIIL